jgi:endonuclease G
MTSRNRSSRRSGKRGIVGLLLKTKWGRRLLAFVNIAALIGVGAWYLGQPETRQEEIRFLVSNYMEQNRNVHFSELALDLWQYYYGDQFLESSFEGGDELIYAGLPIVSGEHGTIKVLKNIGYVSGYSDRAMSPLWVAYRLRHQEKISSAGERPSGFSVDSRTFAKVNSSDYTRSGFDRGHLAPNYGIALNFGREAQLETFLMSNIIPQTHALNAGPWKELEARAAINYPARFQEVWIVTGPIYSSSGPEIAKGIRVPDSCYKIVIDETDGKVRCLAMVMKQDISPSASLDQYIVTVDEVETLTGIDFFGDLEDQVESKLESTKAERIW